MRPPRADTQAQPPILLVGRGRMGRALRRAASGAGLSFATAGRADLEEVAASWTGDTVLLCVPDNEIANAARSTSAAAPRARFIGHTSGATGLGQLTEIGGAGRGKSEISAFSLHPLQTVTGEGSELFGAPAAIAGSNPEALALAASLAGALGLHPFEVPDDARAAYHAAASIASNFLVTLEESAVGLLEAAGVRDGRELLAPLVLRSAENWANAGPAALTGPIARGDERTVARQQEAIEAFAPDLGELYDVLAERTRELAARNSEVPA